MIDEKTRRLLIEAAAAVGDLPESLQVAAFSELLRAHLSGGSNEPPQSKSKSKGVKSRDLGQRKPRRSGASKAVKPNAAAPMAPAIDPTVEQLGAMREFMQGLELKGEEETAFALGMFLYERLKRAEFTIADLEICYRRLLSMKVKLPVVKDFKRATSWLAAPSRKKEWMQRSENGFTISNAGLIAFQDLERERAA